MTTTTLRQQVGKFVEYNEALFTKLNKLADAIEKEIDSPSNTRLTEGKQRRDTLKILRDFQIVQAHLSGIRSVVIADMYGISETVVSLIISNFKKKHGIEKDKPKW